MQSHMFDIFIISNDRDLFIKFYEGQDECSEFYSALYELLDIKSLNYKFRNIMISEEWFIELADVIERRLMSLPVAEEYGYHSYKEVLKHYYDFYSKNNSPVKGNNIVVDLTEPVPTMTDSEFRDAITNLLLGSSYTITDPMNQDQANQVMFNAIVEHYVINKKKRKRDDVTMKPVHPKIKSPTYVCTANGVDYYADVEYDIVAYRSWKLGYESFSYESFKKYYVKLNVPYDVLMKIKEHFDKH